MSHIIKQEESDSINSKGCQFDLNNPQHLAMRKLMVEIHSYHTSALKRGDLVAAIRYRGMSEGLKKVALNVLYDAQLFWLCFELICLFENMEKLYQLRADA